MQHIRAKLILIIVLTIAIAMLLASTIIIAYDYYAYRTQKTGEISAQVEILAASVTASLEFNDPKAAQEYLTPLDANPEITGAAVYTAEGSLLASYFRPGTQPPPPSAQPQAQQLEGGELVIFWPARLRQQQVGTVYLRAKIEPLMTRIVRYGGIVLLVMIISLLITLPVAIRLHYAIANPVFARSLIEASLDPLITINPEGKITDINEASVKITGISRDKLIGTDFSNYFTEPEKARAGYQQVFANGFVTDYPLTIQHRDGKLTDVLYNASVYKDERGKVLGVFAAARDVTIQKNITNELQAANRELEAFSYSVSHDLRAPLRSIDGFSQALLEDYSDKLDEQAMGYLNRVRNATQRMGHLIDDMLNLSRVTRVEMRRETVDLSALANDVLAELQKSEPERQVDCRIDPALVTEGDAQLLRVILVNLLGNAWKYTAKQPQPCIEFYAIRNAHKSTEFIVKDNGAGFDMTYASKLFGAFQRLHLASEFPGTGVGLATVQRIVHRHGGKIRGEGTPNQGAIFSFTLSS